MSGRVSLVDHADAVMALLEAPGGLSVYPLHHGGPKTVPAGAQPPYLGVHFSAVRVLGPVLTLPSSRMRMRIFCYCVGASAAAARVVSDLVAERINGVKPDVPGRNCFPIRQEDGQSAPRPDESIGTLVVTLTEVYRLESVVGIGGS